MQNYVFVLDAAKQPLSPCHPAVARKLLREGKAAVFKRLPFTIILFKWVPDADPAPVQLKVDPGSKTTGMALVQGDKVVFAAELEHRGQRIEKALKDRRAIRRNRRNRKTRYRQARFLNRRRPEGWLAPSLKSRIDNIQTWLVRFVKLCNVRSISMELVRFDTQKMVNPDVSGVEYQQGELVGYEVRGYLLEKWERKCVYCDTTGVPLQIEHIVPKSRGGSNRISNLTLACESCNKAKNNKTAAEFGHPHIQAQAKVPLKDAAAVNTVRWAIWRMFDATGLPVEVGTGGRTKFNRVRQGYPKAHWIDAACVGVSGEQVHLNPGHKPLRIKATGHGNRQMCQTNKYGNAIRHRSNHRSWNGWKTGDMARAVIPRGKYEGVYPLVHVTAKQRDSFKITALTVGAISANRKYLNRVHRKDGYSYIDGNVCL